MRSRKRVTRAELGRAGLEWRTWLSSPRKMSIMKKRQDHSWDKGIIVTALGNAMKARPGPARAQHNQVSTGLLLPSGSAPLWRHCVCACESICMQVSVCVHVCVVG